MTEQSLDRRVQFERMLRRGHGEEGVPYGLLLERAQKWILHFNVERVHGPEEIVYEIDEMVVVCPVRDGRPYVKSFVEHYTSLGVKHMIFLDNGSTDGTVEALKGYENVTVLQTKLPFRRYQVPMRQYLVERFGRGRWCLCVDIDELFDYPYSDVIGLDSFLGYLNSKSYTAVVAQMLDMFPEEPLTGRANRVDEPLKERHRFCDVSNVHKRSYSAIIVGAQDHWAYRRGLYGLSEISAQLPSTANAPSIRGDGSFRCAIGTGNVLANEEIEVYKDGIQNTVFGNHPPLTKHPLVFVDEKIKPMDRSMHSVSDARIADFTCVLFHYKFLNVLYEMVRRAAWQNRYGHNRHKKWLEVLEKNPKLVVKGETAREIRSVNELLENQFLVISEDYVSWVNAHEKRSALQAAPTIEPRELVHSLLESRQRERANTLRVQRLERQLRSRDQEIKKLQKAQQQARHLKRRLERIEASRAWKLLKSLYILKGRVLSLGRSSRWTPNR